MLAEWEHDREPLHAAGSREALVDSDGVAVAVIELVSVEIIRLGDADDRLARDEGEEYATVADWRASHEGHWRDEVGAALRGVRLDDDTPIVVERFRLVAAPPG